MTLEKIFDKISGLFLGLGAGDLIGGPTAMNIIFAKSLLNLKRYDRQDLKERFVDWFNKNGFDTGFITSEALKLLSKGIPEEIAVKMLHQKYLNATAGCNPVHRCFPLAAASFISDDKLAEYAIDQASLTHYSKIVGDVAAATVVLVRQLIKGKQWEEVKQVVSENRMEETKNAFLRNGVSSIVPTGYSPEVLKSSLYFLDKYESFQNALENSIKFSGSANYCPILVGAIGGARWGVREIPETLIKRNKMHLELEKIAKEMYNGWEENYSIR